MKNLLAIVAMLCFFSVSGQNNFEIEYSHGGVFVNLFGESNKYEKNRSHHAIQSEIVLYKTLISFDKLKLRGGVGYNNLWLLGVSDRPREISSYLSIRVGTEIGLLKNKLSFIGHLNNNILLNKADNFFRLDEHKVYSTIDLGFRLKLGKRSKFVFSSPIPILPLYSKDNVTLLTPLSPEFDIISELTGFNIGINWTLSKI
jgi:hypothetical protein